MLVALRHCSVKVGSLCFSVKENAQFMQKIRYLVTRLWHFLA
jgi:hypothetical protein